MNPNGAGAMQGFMHMYTHIHIPLTQSLFTAEVGNGTKLENHEEMRMDTRRTSVTAHRHQD